MQHSQTKMNFRRLEPPDAKVRVSGMKGKLVRRLMPEDEMGIYAIAKTKAKLLNNLYQIIWPRSIRVLSNSRIHPNSITDILPEHSALAMIDERRRSQQGFFG